MKRKIHILVDSIDYVRNEVYQHQLHLALNDRYYCVYYEVNSLTQLNLATDDIVFSALKLRTLLRHVDHIAQAIGDSHIIIQDYDPWVSFEDGSQYKGTYNAIASKLNVTFFVPHREWCNVISKSGLRCITSKIGMMSSYCNARSWESRKHRVEFRGSSYPSRLAGMNRMWDAGFPQHWVHKTVKPYATFLDHLSDVRVWAHSESEPIIVDGKSMCRNWLWPKAIEVLSRGCFLIRDRQQEAENYVKDMPTVFLFDDETQALSLLEQIESMSDTERNDRIRSTVEQIKNERYYEVLADRIEEWWDAK